MAAIQRRDETARHRAEGPGGDGDQQGVDAEHDEPPAYHRADAARIGIARLVEAAGELAGGALQPAQRREPGPGAFLMLAKEDDTQSRRERLRAEGREDGR